MKIVKEIELYPYSSRKGWVRLMSCNDMYDEKEKFIATISSLSRGNIDAVCPDRWKTIYQNLLKQQHYKMLEFVRLSPDWDIKTSCRHSPFYFTETKTITDNVALFQFKVPIFVARQMMVYRVTWLEMSRRYVTDRRVPFDFWFPPNSDPLYEKDCAHNWLEEYANAIDAGCKPEIARAFMPQSTYTYVYGMFNVPALKHFLEERLHKSAQEQTRDVANAMKELVWKEQPRMYERIITNA